MSSTPENDLFAALVDITGAGAVKVAGLAEMKDSKKEEKEEKDAYMKADKGEDADREEESGSKLAELIDHPSFLAGFERRLIELRNEHGFLGD